MNKDKQYQKYLAELKRHKWKIVQESKSRNCIHPREESLTCGEYREGTVLLVPKGKINYPETYVGNREFWTCPRHLSFYQIEYE